MTQQIEKSKSATQTHPWMFQGNEIRSLVGQDGIPWFVAKDICEVLKLSNPRKAISSLDDDEKSGVTISDPHGRSQITNVVNESGMYALVFKSRKPSAKVFRKWVTSEVLPAIRETGSYEMRQEVQRLRTEVEYLQKQNSTSLKIQGELFSNADILPPVAKVRGLLAAFSKKGISMQVICRFLKEETGFCAHTIRDQIRSMGGKATLLSIINAHGHAQKALEIACRLLY